MTSAATTYAERARRSAALQSSSAISPPATVPRPNSSNSDNWRAETAPALAEPLLEKIAAPVPKLNVWSVRKEQLAAAVVVAPPTPAPSTPRIPTKSTTSRTTTKAIPATNETKSTSNPTLPKIKSNTPVLTPPPTETPPTLSKRVPEGWTGITATPALSAPDKESWPSPIEEIKKGKLKQSAPLDDTPDELIPKKKADKTKWIPIEADITVNGTSTAPRFAASSSTSTPNDKRTKRTTKDSDSTTNRSRRNSTATETKSKSSTSKGKNSSSHGNSNSNSVGENGGERKKSSGMTGEGKKVSQRENTAAKPVLSNSVSGGKHAKNGSTSTKPRTTMTTDGATNLANLVAALPIAVSNEVAKLISNEMAASAPLDSSLASLPSTSSTATATTTATTTTQEKTDTSRQSLSSAASATSFSSSTPHAHYSTDFSSSSTTSANYQGSNPVPNYRPQQNNLRASGGNGRGGSSGSRGGGGRGGMRNGNGFGGRTNGFEYDPNLAPPFGFIDAAAFYPPSFPPQQSPSFPPSSYPQQSFVGAPGVGVGAMAGGGGAMGGGMPILDPYSLDPTRYWLLGQIEYYFSFENLCRDMFLRSKMDDAGWIPIPLISSFNRIKNLSTDLGIISDTMSLTPLLEMNGNFVRLRGNWFEWLLPGAARSTVLPPVTPSIPAIPTTTAQMTTTPNGAEEKSIEQPNGISKSTESSHTLIPLKIGSPKSPARQLGAEIREGKLELDADVEILDEETALGGTGGGVNGIGGERSAVLESGEGGEKEA